MFHRRFSTITYLLNARMQVSQLNCISRDLLSILIVHALAFLLLNRKSIRNTQRCCLRQFCSIRSWILRPISVKRAGTGFSCARNTGRNDYYEVPHSDIGRGSLTAARLQAAPVLFSVKVTPYESFALWSPLPFLSSHSLVPSFNTHCSFRCQW